MLEAEGRKVPMMPEAFRQITPNMLTSLGILGTFVGIVLGLSDLELSDRELMQQGIQTLIEGMGTAFITSVAGILGSIAVTAQAKFWEGRFHVSARAKTADRGHPEDKTEGDGQAEPGPWMKRRQRLRA